MLSSHVRRSILWVSSTLLLSSLIPCQNAFAQDAAASSPITKNDSGKLSPSKLSDEQKISLAMSAAPPDVAQNATIAEMTSMSGAEAKTLREGSNGWVCYALPDEPMCLDKEWQKWMKAYMSKTDVKVAGTGIAYMLQGDRGASNTDPYAHGPKSGNDWVVSPAHLMILFPDPSMLDAYPTGPQSGGPWVMWKGTPYAHLMLPVSNSKKPVMQAGQ